MRIVIDHTAADEAARLELVASRDEPGHFDGPTPTEALREPWASWPDWTDERWEPADPEPFGRPVGTRRDPGRRSSRLVSDLDQDVYGRPARYLADDRLIDRLGRGDGYPA